jgi:hypothetical protein
MGSIIVLLLNILLFFPAQLFIKIPILYGIITLTILFLFVIFTAASVNYEANKSYKLLNDLYVKRFVINGRLFYNRRKVIKPLIIHLKVRYVIMNVIIRPNLKLL